MTSTAADAGVALVTGASGFAGTQLVGQLRERGYRVVAPDREELDIADVRGLKALIERERPTVVFHLAAIVDTVTTPSIEELTRVNVGGTEAVVDAVYAVDRSIRVVLASSSFVYGSTTPEEQPLSEDQPLRPLTPYGDSKVAAEGIVRDHVARGGNAVTARAFQHTGPGHVGAYALSDWAEQLARGSSEIATGSLDVERDYLDVRDVVNAYILLSESGVSGEIYNVSSGSGVTMRLLLEGLIAAFSSDAQIVTDPARVRAVDQPVVIGDRSKLTDATGWQPQYSLEATLEDLAKFWRERVAA